MTDTHIVFENSAKEILREAISSAQISDNVLCYPDFPHIGPIDGGSYDSRLEWLERELHLSRDYWNSHSNIERFWDAADRSSTRVVWYSQRRPDVYCGFLEFLWCSGHLACDFIDLSEIEHIWCRPEDQPHTRTFHDLGPLIPSRVLSDGLIENARPLSGIEKDNYLTAWQKLQSENAPLRVICEKTLVSATLEFYDGLLLSVVNHQWRKVHRILAEAMAQSYDGPFQQADFFVLRARVLALVAEGLLEGRGDFFVVRDDLGEFMRMSDLRRR